MYASSKSSTHSPITGTGHAVAHTLAYAYAGWVFFAVPLSLAATTVDVRVDPLSVPFIVAASTPASFVPTPGGLGGGAALRRVRQA